MNDFIYLFARITGSRWMIDAEDVKVDTCFEYNEAHPLEITVTFANAGVDGEHVDWNFARDLIQEAYEMGAAGEGDVEIMTNKDENRTVIRLSSDEGIALIEYPCDTLINFVWETYEHIGPGDEAEYLDIDVQLATLLEG
jgi:hypothetical protein